MFSFAGDLTKFSLVQSEKSAAGSKHCFLFNGEAFEQKEEFRMLKSFFLGIFLFFFCFVVIMELGAE